ncbi:YqgE/AlgH family protein [Algoriphagus halophytocola]|uniref:YqgE/AlgH family protein n=1 Tax=Algoriphagus halophytocola TaxID=2991499 RepID=A0ABY6MM71_9BACT|nr:MULTISPECIES: YqgE/AlgH family protein [unclassified Algoriphagus]UZD23497.1 YqgE/AlgH family protein [Algoriphagus sp. TR-M5]WBL44791.1 YqgE/AlgH family protein [Algoriphagus sp. TR-M9]
MNKNKLKIPKAGDLLISEPFLQDENFVRSVVLLCEHSEEGSFGLVINKPSILKLNELVQALDFLEKEVFVGGPVEQNTLHFIYTGEQVLDGSVSLGDHIWWGGDYESLVDKLKLGLLDPDSVRFFLGYSGWGTDQLKEELDDETWIICRENLNEQTLKLTPEELWKSLLKNMGGEFKVIANYPLDPRLN